MRDVEIRWETTVLRHLASGLTVEDVEDLRCDTLDVEAAPGSSAPASS